MSITFRYLSLDLYLALAFLGKYSMIHILMLMNADLFIFFLLACALFLQHYVHLGYIHIVT